MKSKKQLTVTYSFMDYEQKERQRKLDDALDVIFDELDTEDLERTNNKDEYVHEVVIKR